MTRTAFLKKYALRFAAAFVPLVLIVYTVFHVFGSSSGSLMTTPARRMTDVQTVNGQGYLFREETVLTADRPCVVQDLAESGAKVNRGGEVATLYFGYTEEEAKAAQTQLLAINRMLNILEKSRIPEGTSPAQAQKFRAEAEAAYKSLRQALVAGNWTPVTALENQMLIFLGKYEALLNADTDEREALYTELSRQKETLLRGMGTTLTSETSSGYYFSRDHVDGLESVFTAEALAKLGAEDPKVLLESAAPPGDGFYAGKLVWGNRWYLAIPLTSTAGERLEIGERYAFTFPENNGCELELICSEVREGEGGVVAVFASDEVPQGFAWLRVQPIRITVGSTTGYYVPLSAMREVDGAEGVYIFEIGTVYFRRVEVLYRGDGYCMVAEQGDRMDYLALNDMMITSDGDFYDGRVYE